MGIAYMQRDPEFFPEPDVFRPERFLAEKVAGKDNPYKYVPFSAGPRNCIGQKFALLEIKSLVTKLLRNFEISVDSSYPGPELIAEVVLKPQNGVLLNFERRT